ARLSFDEAAELAYFGAKILHPQSVFPAQKYKIPVRLLNTMEPSAPGTLISSESEKGKIKSIAAKDGITAIKIQSSRMLLAYGFLRRVFEVFERYKTPIDMITTSEVAVSLTIDDTTNLQDILKELNTFGKVEVDTDQAIICIVGDFGAERHGYASRVLESLKHIPLRMISYGGSNYNISLLLKSADKVEALRSLHNRLFD
ncbi:MAG TPA: aspartate kinase, partial [Sphingobacteriaceae bacterium]